MNPERRKQRRVELQIIFQEFANKLANVLDEIDAEHHAGDERANAPARTRRTATRAPYVPTPHEKPSAEATEKATRGARRAGIPL